MRDQNKILTISEFLIQSGWVAVNDSLFVNDNIEAHIKLNNHQISYYIKKQLKKEIPLEIAIHSLSVFPNYLSYQKTLQLIRLLKNRGFSVNYDYGNFRWGDTDSFTDFESLHIIKLITNNFIIGFGTDGSLQIYYNDGSSGVYHEDEVIRGIMIELALLLNHNYYFNHKKDSLDIEPSKRLEISKSNQDYFSNY